MEIIKVKSDKEVGKALGDIIINLVKNKPNAILGLATGSSPVSTYQYLIEDYKNNNTDYSKVKTFNLDEYIGLKENDEHSYRYFMDNTLFNHINIDKKNTFIPEPRKFLENPESYDKEIEEAGGIDLQVLGVGENGHIGFNEPPVSFDSLTHIENLAESTIEANSRFFEKKEDVPIKAISMGLESIMKVKKIVLIAIGEKKQEAIFQLVKGKKSVDWPCTILKDHSDFVLIVDEKASGRIN